MPVRRFWLLALTIPATLAAQEPPWRELVRATFRGNVTFPAEDLRTALCWSAPALAALRDEEPEVAAAVLATALRDGYRHMGFPAADVRVEPGEAGFGFTIDEGTRCRPGVIVITGNHRVPTAELLVRLQQPFVGLPGQTAAFGEGFAGAWVAGKHARCGEFQTAAAVAALQRGYAELGLPNARVTASFQRHGDVLDLHLAVADEGAEMRVASLAIVGERLDAVDGVLRRLRFTPGCLFTRTFRTDLERQLLRTGRYATVNIEDPPVGRTTLDPLVLRVQQYENAPLDDEAGQRDFAQVLAGFDWLEEHFAAGRGVSAEVELPADIGERTTQLGPGSLQLLVDRNALRITLPAVRGLDGSFAPLSWHMTKDGMRLQHGRRWAAVRFHGDSGFCWWVTTRPAAGQRGEIAHGQELRWGIGLHTRAKPWEPAVRFHPTVAAYQVRGGATSVRRDGADLLMQIQDAELRIGPNGAMTPRALSFPATEGRPSFRIALLDEPIADLPGAGEAAVADEVAPLSLLLPLATALAEKAIDRTARDAGPAVALLGSAAQVVLTPALAWGTAEEDRFRLPAPAPTDRHDESQQVLTGFGCGMVAAAMAWPGDGWPVALFGTGPYLLGDGGSVQRGAAYLYELRKDPRCGPLALGVVGSVLRGLGFPRPADGVFAEAVRRCSFDEAFADLASVTSPDGPAGEVLRALGRRWRTDPATAACCKVVDGPGADLEASRLGLRVLWDAGLGEALQQALGRAGR